VLDAATAPPGSMFRAGLEIKTLTCAGFAPILRRCAACGEPLDGPCRFSMEAGGALHAGCGPGEPTSAAFVEALERARMTRLVELLDLDLPPGPGWLLARFAEHHLQRGLDSRKWLQGLE
jgi:recombinational DNA repair protein (RecF pathway)